MYSNPFNSQLEEAIRKKFAFVDFDPHYGPRLFFDNSGGSLRLSSSVTERYTLDLLPDCPERYHARANDFNQLMDSTREEILSTVLGAKSGSIITELTASQVFFNVVSVILENCQGTNVVTTNVEHPSAYDSLKMYAEKNDLDFRVAEANKETGFVDPESVAELVDDGTIVVSVISASNISGNIMDIKTIGKECKKKNSNIFFISDAVQHLPHGLVDVEDMDLDFLNFAPYKFFASRGLGIGYASERLSQLTHHKLNGKDSSVWELGSPAPAVFKSFLEVIDYVCWIGEHFINSRNRRELYIEGITKIAEKERYLLNLLLEGDAEIEGLRSMAGAKAFVDYADLTRRDLIVAMEIEGLDHTKAVARYQEKGVTVYERVNTSIYSKRIVESLGLTGAIRVSPLHVHTKDDIHQFLLITKDLIHQVQK